MLAGFTSGLESGAYNIAFGSSHKMEDVFRIIIKKIRTYTGISVELISEPWPKNFDQIEKRSFFADKSKFKRATNWEPTITLDTGLEALMKYLF